MGNGLKKRNDRETDRHCVDFNIDKVVQKLKLSINNFFKRCAPKQSFVIKKN